MITSAGVGGVGGAGMLRARRRDVSIKPNRKLDRKSSRGMIYENEELRLRTININAEVEQGHNDIKKLRRENEQLRREIWCLREEYDKLEEILKSQKSRENSENDEDSSDECSSDVNLEEEEEEEAEEEEDDEEEEEINVSDNEKEKLLKKTESIQDELLENAENQKLSTEKMNSIHRLHVEFDKLSTVTEEEETKKDKNSLKNDDKELIKPETTEIVDKRDEKYLTGHTFNWIYSPDSPVLPSLNDESVYHPPAPSIQRLITLDGDQVSRKIGWNSIFDAKSSLNPSPTVLPKVLTSSSANKTTGSLVHQKTSPDICVSGAVPNQLHNSQSSDNLLSSTRRDNLAKSLSHSCQELKSNLFREDYKSIIKGGIAKSLPDNSKDSPKAFRSQLRVHLTQPSGKPPDIPPEMPPLDCTLCQPTLDNDRRHRRLLRHLQLQEYQATSFEHPNPQTLPVPLNPFTPRSDKTIYRDVGYLPVWPDIPPPPPPPPRVDTQTQTQSQSPTPSTSSGHDGHKEDGKTFKSKSTIEKKKMRKKSERISTPSIEGKKQKNRNSQVSRRRSKSRSQSIACTEVELKNFKDTTIAGGIEAEKEFRKNSVAVTEKLPWCACWGNGCV